MVMWLGRIRSHALTVGDPISYRSLTLVENYNAPDVLLLTGPPANLEDIQPGEGIWLADDTGAQRFSGPLVSREILCDEQGRESAVLIFNSDMVRLWWRICYMATSNDWIGAGGVGAAQDASDVVTGSAEGKLLSLINRNAGPGARTERQVPHLRLPTSSGRGPTGATTVRGDILGQVATDLAESADLRLSTKLTYESGTPYIDVVLAAAPDLSSAYRFGTARDAPMQVGVPWRYKFDAPTASTVLGGAGGTSTSRIFQYATDTAAESLWQERIEQFVDIGETTDLTEVTNSIAEALDAAKGPTEVAVALPDSPDVRALPLGAKVSVNLRSFPIVDRLRQRTTTVARNSGDATTTVTAVFGGPDAGVKSPTQRQLAALHRQAQIFQRR